VCPSNTPGPIEQVLVYTLGTGNQFTSGTSVPVGATEVEFNYAGPLAGGPATFTFDGVHFASTGAGVPSGTLNDFIFNTNGTLFGGVSEDGTSRVDIPQGWKIVATPLPPSVLLFVSGLLSLVLVGRLGGARSSRRLTLAEC
jgi:hypothetical protein